MPRERLYESLANGLVRLYPGDMRDVLRMLGDSTIDACVTDPPYHLSGGFMGQKWDSGDLAFQPETWREVHRVLKPGAHLLAFGGTPTYDMLGYAIRQAGFEIRDSLAWMYGSGFPKSYDTAQAIEKLLTTGKSRRPDRDLGGLPRDRYSGDVEGKLFANTGGKVPLTRPEAKQFAGFGTGLKPAFEPIVLARKPLSEKTIAANVLRWGTGALNIDGCRVEAGADHAANCARTFQSGIWKKSGEAAREITTEANAAGRWPANVVHDGSDEVVEAFPHTKSGLLQTHHRMRESENNSMSGKNYARQPRQDSFGDEGSAARFFYSAKADGHDRLDSSHPTVKPVDLKQYLIRLVTPPRGVVLDPFAGTGTTGEAAVLERFRAVLIEREAAFCDDIRRRMATINRPAQRANLTANRNAATLPLPKFLTL